MPLLYETYQKRSLQKVSTDTRIYLWNETQTQRLEGKTVDVGTKILVRGALFAKVNGLSGLSGKTLRIYGRLNTGTWQLMKEAPTDGNAVDVTYTLTSKGVYTFYAEFLGNGEYSPSKSTEAKVGAGVSAAIPFPKEYLIAAGLGIGGLVLVALSLRRRR